MENETLIMEIIFKFSTIWLPILLLSFLTILGIVKIIAKYSAKVTKIINDDSKDSSEKLEDIADILEDTEKEIEDKVEDFKEDLDKLKNDKGDKNND